MVEGVSVPSLICMAEMNARSGAKSHRKSFKIELGTVQKSSEINTRGFSGVSGALGSMNAERRADKDEKCSHFGTN